MTQGERIAFVNANNQIVTGFLRRSEKLSDYWLVEANGKRYLITDEEIIRDEKVYSEKEEIEKTPARRKRGRPRKLG